MRLLQWVGAVTVGFTSAAGWFLLDWRAHVWLALPFAILIGVGNVCSLYAFGRARYYEGRADVYREQFERELRALIYKEHQ